MNAQYYTEIGIGTPVQTVSHLIWLVPNLFDPLV